MPISSKFVFIIWLWRIRTGRRREKRYSAAYQCLFGNPLVSPDILGVSAGSGFGAALGILFSASAFVIQGQALLNQNLKLCNLTSAQKTIEF